MENFYQNTFSNNTTLSKAFQNMSIGLFITAITSFVAYSSGLYYTVVSSFPMIGILLLIVQVVLTFTMSRSLNSTTSVGSMRAQFFVYSLMMGFTMASLGYAYSLGQISAAFLVSAIYFICLAIVGKTTKKDLSKLGTICTVALFALVITQLLLTLFRVSMDVRLWSIVGLLIFTGITAWDIQKLDRMSYGLTNDKLAIYFALELYLDFINIFLYILRLMASRSNND
jgi:uncharacterized protein